MRNCRRPRRGTNSVAWMLNLNPWNGFSLLCSAPGCWWLAANSSGACARGCSSSWLPRISQTTAGWKSRGDSGLCRSCSASRLPIWKHYSRSEAPRLWGSAGRRWRKHWRRSWHPAASNHCRLCPRRQQALQRGNTFRGPMKSRWFIGRLVLVRPPASGNDGRLVGRVVGPVGVDDGPEIDRRGAAREFQIADTAVDEGIV